MTRRTATTTRTEAMLRGLLFLERYALDDECWNECSADVQYMFFHLSTRPRQPAVVRRARALAVRAGARWCAENERLPEDARAVDLVWHYAYGTYTARALGFDTRAMRRDLARAVREHSTTALIGADPRRALPPDDRTRGYRLWQDALVGAHIAAELDLDVGCTVRDVVDWRRHLLPYPDARRRLTWKAWHAFYAVTHLVYVLDDYSLRALPAARLLPEAAFVRDVCEHGIVSGDVELLGESLDALLALGADGASDVVRRARETLLRLQNRDGSWGPRSDEPYTRFHKTWVALDGLAEYGVRPLALPRLPGVPPQSVSTAAPHV